MKPISPFGLPIGISMTFWSLVGLLRLFYEKILGKYPYKHNGPNRFEVSDIAVILPAHNEELLIRKSVQALKELLNPKQIYVVSDGSVDKTYRRGRMEGVHVSYLNPGRGKAKALVYLLKRFRLFDKYKLIFIVDADTMIDKDFLKNALPVFNDSDTAVVFASSKIHWPAHFLPNLGLYFVAYRDRLVHLLKYLLIYGQTWKYTNVNYVIPGFATLYRSEVLKQLEIDTPGLLIEDFNLAFQLHKKRLGKIGYLPGAIAWDHYPNNLSDYWKQVRRWNIGFFQTARKNGIWPSFFWLAVGIFSIEVLLSSVFVILLPLLVIFWIIQLLPYSNPLLSTYQTFYLAFGPYQYLNLKDILLSVFLLDYAVTLIIGFINRRPQFIFYGLFFFFMHYVTSLILISSVIPGFFSSSAGTWVPPKRS